MKKSRDCARCSCWRSRIWAISSSTSSASSMGFGWSPYSFLVSISSRYWVYKLKVDLARVCVCSLAPAKLCRSSAKCKGSSRLAGWRGWLPWRSGRPASATSRGQSGAAWPLLSLHQLGAPPVNSWSGCRCGPSQSYRQGRGGRARVRESLERGHGAGGSSSKTAPTPARRRWLGARGSAGRL